MTKIKKKSILTETPINVILMDTNYEENSYSITSSSILKSPALFRRSLSTSLSTSFSSDSAANLPYFTAYFILYFDCYHSACQEQYKKSVIKTTPFNTNSEQRSSWRYFNLILKALRPPRRSISTSLSDKFEKSITSNFTKNSLKNLAFSA